jgi:hypothetical protein
MVDEVEKRPGQGPRGAVHTDATALQKKVKVGLGAEQRLDEGGIAPWEIRGLRKLAAEGREAQRQLRTHGHEPSMPEEASPDD